MTKSGMVLKLTNIMKKHERSNDEILFERRNIASWFDACEADGVDALKAKESFLCRNIGRAEQAKDSAYVDCRRLFLAIVRNFIPHEMKDIPF